MRRTYPRLRTAPTKKAKDVKEELSEEKAEKESQPVGEKVVDPKASSAKGPDAGAKESPRSARSAVVLKSAADPAVKEKAEAVLGKEDPGAKAPHPREDKDTGVKASHVKEEDDPGAKACHGSSSDDEDNEALDHYSCQWRWICSDVQWHVSYGAHLGLGTHVTVNAGEGHLRLVGTHCGK